MILRRADFANCNIVVDPDGTGSDEEVCGDLRVEDSFREAGGQRLQRALSNDTGPM